MRYINSINYISRTFLKCIKSLCRYNPYITILIILSYAKTTILISMFITFYIYMTIHQIIFLLWIK